MKIEHLRADLTQLAQEGAAELLKAEEEQAARLAREVAPQKHTEEYGVIIRERWSQQARRPYYVGEVIGRLPGSTGDTRVEAWTRDGVFAMCHRAYLEILTTSGVNADVARRRAAEAEFYVATVIV